MLAAHPAEPFDLVVLALGVNDVTRGTSAARWRREQTALLAMLVRRHGARQILCSGVPPLGQFPLLPEPLRWVLGAQARRLDAVLAALVAETPQAVHLPFRMPLTPDLMASDGYHPGPAAYAHWAEMLAAEVGS
jgi:lysophospholipase L1-like esterase